MKLYPEDTLRRFEFSVIVDRIVDLASSQKAKEFAGELRPVDETDQIEQWLNQTFESKQIIENGIFFPEYAFPNISRELAKLGIQNAVLEGQEIIKLRKVAEVAASVIKFLADKRDLYPALKEITAGMAASNDLIKIIDAILEPNGFIKSNASKELGAARKALSEARQKANKVFEAAVRKYKKLGWLREFDESYYNFVIHEIREMQIANMGQYAHGNQPIQHMPYLYNYAGEPWKSQFWIRETMDRMYMPTPDGYCGDEDNGQTSAWYVFSAMGFYPVCPGTDEYVIGAPLFKKVTIQLENGNEVIINAPENNADNKYIQAASVNGKTHTKNWLSHTELMKGAVIDFTMGPEPNQQRGVKQEDFPYSLSNAQR